VDTRDGGFLIIPMLTCVDTQAEIAFCKQAFGAALLSERLWTDGRVIHATLAGGQALFMVHGEISHLASQEPQHDGSSSVVLYLYLSDPDKTIEDAVRAGASVLLPAKDEPWGDRVGRIMDPAGHVWNIARRAAARP
jgi:PhnB protein